MTASPTATPTVDLDPMVLFADPYPLYAQLRRDTPVAYVPAMGRLLVTRYEDVVTVSRDWETFSAREDTPGPEHKIIGETLMSFDGEEDHLRLRRMMDAPLKPRALREHWEPVFRANAAALLDDLAGRGEADLFADFATPLAAMNLASFLGFEGVSAQQLIDWCKGIIDAGGGYMLDDAGIWERGFAARDGVIAATDAAADRVRGNPDPSMISSIINSPEPMTPQQLYSNIMITIGGGLNEPRDVLLTAAYGLLTNPDQLAAVRAEPSLWKKTFEEACRWVSPIGMFIRQVARPVELGGVRLQPGDKITGVVASANRDERVYADPDVFDIHRKGPSHVAFGGGGPHFCIGAWAARASIGTIALPALFDRLPNLRLDPEREVPWGGFVFRGPLAMPVRWDA
ncbi:cytochrome P450 [Streptomyces blattellae]|uniref:cytochrome P450 n=1 Tax=Streptomyces blattellae TaxID=2569855 RepID=UPI001E5300DF|nr:cytochrome P450 [Streptomyces blattellae]